MEPHAVPEHPWPGTPLWIVHVTAVVGAFVTVAKKCWVSGEHLDGSRNAYSGAIVMVAPAFGDVIEIVAVPLLEGSATLIAVTTTVFGLGAVEGAR